MLQYIVYCIDYNISYVMRPIENEVEGVTYRRGEHGMARHGLMVCALDIFKDRMAIWPYTTLASACCQGQTHLERYVSDNKL